MATGQTHGGKGSAARPTDKKKYEDNYDAIFGKKKKAEILSADDHAVILRNRMRTPDGTMLESKHRHDYVTHMDANGKEYMLDGGLDYVRCSAHGDEEMFTLMSDDSHEVIREVVTWGTYGREGDQPITHVKIADMDDDHLQACIDGTKGYPRPAIRKVMQDELEYRNEN
jgi:hypothetical protein